MPPEKKMDKKKFIYAILTAALFLTGGKGLMHGQNFWISNDTAAHNLVWEEKLRQRIGFLADSLCDGRATGGRGATEAAAWIIRQFKKAGLMPLDSTYSKHVFAGHGTVGHNIAGMLPGSRKKAPDSYIIIGAHYDHLGYDPALEGDNIYNGADDNASGVSAVLQLVKAFLATGAQPERTVIFAFWDGEEKGLLGSEYFVQTFPGISKVKGYLNYDMIGRNADESNPGYLMYFYTEAHPVFGDWLKDSVEKYGLDLAPDYRAWDRPVGGSDNASFALRNVPVIWYHTAGHPDYHMPGDHTGRINWNKIVDITKASFISAWNLANEKEY